MTPVSDFSSRGSCGESAVSPLWFSASACRPKPRLRSCRVPGEFSCGQFLVSDSLAHDGENKGIEALKCVVGDVASIQPESEFIHVPAQMFDTDLVIDAVDSSFENSPHALNAVCASRADAVLASGMIDGIMFEKQTVQVGEKQMLVSIELRSHFDAFVNALSHNLQAALFERRGNGAPVTLSHSKDGSFSDRAATGLELFGFVFVALFAADETLVQFHDAFELVNAAGVGTGFAQTLKHEPCGLLRDANLFSQLHRG